MNKYQYLVTYQNKDLITITIQILDESEMIDGISKFNIKTYTNIIKNNCYETSNILTDIMSDLINIQEYIYQYHFIANTLLGYTDRVKIVNKIIIPKIINKLNDLNTLYSGLEWKYKYNEKDEK